MPRVTLLHPKFQPSALALAILAASATLAHAEDTQLQTVTVQAEQTDDDALPTRPPRSTAASKPKCWTPRAQSPR